jgi:hypothetical protein
MMCPACLLTISMVVAGVVSTGGMTALVVKAAGRGIASGKANSDGVNLGEDLRNTATKEKQS